MEGSPPLVTTHSGTQTFATAGGGLAWFLKPALEEKTWQQVDGAAMEGTSDQLGAYVKELLKQAKLNFMKNEPEEAQLILHDVLHLAFQSNNKKAITYT